MYRMVDTATWDDGWFSELPSDAKLLFLNLLTNNRSTPAGAFQVTIRTMAFETGLSTDRVAEMLSIFGDRVVYWPEHQIVWVKNFYRRQRPNDKFAIGARQAIAKMPSVVRERVCQEYPELREPTDTPSPPQDTPSIPTGTGMDTHLLRRAPVVALENEEGETGAKAPASAVAEPSQSPPSPPVAPPPKPRTPKQQAADALYDRRKSLFDAYCRGVGIDVDSFPAEQRKRQGFRDLQPVEKTDWSCAEMEELSRYTAAAYRWRQGKQTPSVSEVLLAFPEWDNAGRPDEPPKPPPRASPNGRNGSLSAAELAARAVELERQGL